MSPDDTVGMVVTIANSAGDDAVDVKGILRTSDRYVRIIDSVSTFGDILRGSEGSNGKPFVFTASPETPDGHRAEFVLHVSSNKGIYREEIPFEIMVSIFQMPSRETGGFALSQNVPNPHAGYTEIEYRIPQRGSVRLSLYDPAGRLVSTILDREHESGSYRASWNGLGTDRVPLQSGVYFYFLQHSSLTLTRKMILTRKGDGRW